MGFDGEAIKEIFFLIPKDPLAGTLQVPLVRNPLQDCCDKFQLKVLADTSDDDEFKNDENWPFLGFNDVISAVVMKLMKWDNTTGSYIEAATLNDNTYGIFCAYGFFVNDEGIKFIGYKLKWRNVLSIKGAGTYKIKFEATSSLTGTQNFETLEYCLKPFSAALAEGTVKVEYYNSGINGTSNDDQKLIDLGELNWYNALRLNGYFGFPNSEYTRDKIQYNNGQRDWVEDVQEPEFLLKLYPQPQAVHDIFRTDVMQADSIYITDYNTRNPGSYVKKNVQPSSGYSPDWKKMISKLAPVEVKFQQVYNNLRKRRC